MHKSTSEYIEQGLNIKFSDSTKHIIDVGSVIVEIPKSTVILHQGDKAGELYYIIKGIMRGYYLDMDGNDITKCFTCERAIVCSEGLRNEGHASFNVESTEKCICIMIPYQDIRLIVQEDEQARTLFENYILNALCYYEKREQELMAKDAMTRYMNFKKEYGDNEKRISLGHVASYIGVRPSSLSRLRRKIADPCQ